MRSEFPQAYFYFNLHKILFQTFSWSRQYLAEKCVPSLQTLWGAQRIQTNICACSGLVFSFSSQVASWAHITDQAWQKVDLVPHIFPIQFCSSPIFQNPFSHCFFFFFPKLKYVIEARLRVKISVVSERYPSCQSGQQDGILITQVTTLA